MNYYTKNGNNDFIQLLSYLVVFGSFISNLNFIGSKLNSSIGLNSGMGVTAVSLHLNGGKFSWVGPATAVNSKEGNESLLAIFASKAPYLQQ